MATRTFVLTDNRPATRDGAFGACRATYTDVITEVDGGVHVATRVKGRVEGSAVDQRSASFYGSVTMEKAAAYRLRMGYTEVV